MNVTEVERKESTKHCCGNGCRRRDSAEHEEESGALIDKKITENNITNADRRVDGRLEEIVNTENLNRAYKRVKRNKGAGGVDGMGVDELLQYLKDNGEEIRESITGRKIPTSPGTEGRNTQREREETETGNTNSSRSCHPAGNSTGTDTHI